MDKKICTKCKIEKVTSDFSLRSDTGKYRNQCKKCTKKRTDTYRINNPETFKRANKKYREKNKKKLNIYSKNHYRNNIWKYLLRNIKARCENLNDIYYKDYGGRGIKCLINESELKELWFRDQAYNLKKPSIDRIDNDGNYEYGNCQFIEMTENSAKDKRKPILQYDKQGKFIREWDSIASVQNIFNITACCKNKVKSAGGFIWRYKN